MKLWLAHVAEKTNFLFDYLAKAAYYGCMDVISTILASAKQVGVSGHLLLAICSAESRLNPETYVHVDGKTPSIGVCQVKADTARLLGFRGNPIELMKVSVNSLYSAKYLRYQLDRYNNNWVMATAAYNSGTYNPSEKVIGCPKNLRYIKDVKSNISQEYKHKLECGQ